MEESCHLVAWWACGATRFRGRLLRSRASLVEDAAEVSSGQNPCRVRDSLGTAGGVPVQCLHLSVVSNILTCRTTWRESGFVNRPADAERRSDPEGGSAGSRRRPGQGEPVSSVANQDMDMPTFATRWDSLTDAKLAELLRLIAHPTRLVILRAVASGERCVAQLNELVPVSQPNLSQHLRVLRDSELICCRREGRRRCYSLAGGQAVRKVLEVVVLASGGDVSGTTRSRPYGSPCSQDLSADSSPAPPPSDCCS